MLTCMTHHLCQRQEQVDRYQINSPFDDGYNLPTAASTMATATFDSLHVHKVPMLL
jgi:hypothetical protein